MVYSIIYKAVFELEEKGLGFIGAGNMAGAIINGIVGTKTFPAQKIYVYDINTEKSEALKKKAGIQSVPSLDELVKNCSILFLAVKPQNFSEVLADLKPFVNDRILFVSIAAGISTSYITRELGCNCPVIRTMPNTPLLVGKGATAMCKTANVADEDFQLVQSLFAACGTVTVLDEKQMNAVISVNSSSPAYVYLFAKAMMDSAVKQGIDAATALELICQTFEGSAEMLRQPGLTPESLIKMVSSPGGTTLKALDVFYAHHFEGIVDEAMKACTKRAEELGK
ncbi:pyrroline-5-carboxylate reductase [Caproiciproducens galactitolivorans]|uniref:Pyrroline-5-carboxylate reductase n=1 Tax=Caproiciproducens galactitolivorans TaxID=642589 RepID=A0A4Z0YI08_9FIRM|nr:pyrroline-5-carboxylate reductase [Caproiciproducens galactitolivorans]QEY34072.1 pyrroline-5-carboxylate reductase [Caproiciproducens galactitolivorans]TGJ76512.1 pyrroline-5-carboxylate reductase [Caproiciproducens galactitolivorans]